MMKYSGMLLRDIIALISVRCSMFDALSHSCSLHRQRAKSEIENETDGHVSEILVLDYQFPTPG